MKLDEWSVDDDEIVNTPPKGRLDRGKTNWSGFIVAAVIIGLLYIALSSKSTNVPSATGSTTSSGVVGSSITPEQSLESKQQVLANQQQCSKDASAYYNNIYYSTNAGNTNPNEKYVWDTPEFHYSSQLNTCLLYVRYVQIWSFDTSKSNQFNEVIDVYSNKIILNGFFIRDVSKNTESVDSFGNEINGVPNYTSTEFFQQKDKLFSA